MRTHDTRPRIVSAAKFPVAVTVLLDGFLIQRDMPKRAFASARAL
jgi:hypothetical protein